MRRKLQTAVHKIFEEHERRINEAVDRPLIGINDPYPDVIELLQTRGRIKEKLNKFHKKPNIKNLIELHDEVEHLRMTNVNSHRLIELTQKLQKLISVSEHVKKISKFWETINPKTIFVKKSDIEEIARLAELPHKEQEEIEYHGGFRAVIIGRKIQIIPVYSMRVLAQKQSGIYFKPLLESGAQGMWHTHPGASSYTKFSNLGSGDLHYTKSLGIPIIAISNIGNIVFAKPRCVIGINGKQFEVKVVN